MTIEKLIELCERRITHLNATRQHFEALGDIAQIEDIELELATTQETLNVLNSINI